MTDDELEEWLSRYRPVGPADELRERVLTSEERRARTTWMSIAALIIAIIVLQVLAAGERASIRARMEDPAAREVLVRELARRLGGGEFSLETARALVEASEIPGDGK